ncbi:MAG: hypothetical protein OXG49_17995 [Chloroflexi bacterium]|nr:hypothetical protein [Chloroflexota bacterium]
MQSPIARFLRLCVFFYLFAHGAIAQDTPTITISPASGEVETAVFMIEIDGLQPDTRYTIEILFEGEVVFSSDETSDQAGHIPYPISSTEGDAPGAYSLQVLLRDQLIASGEFTLTEAAPTPEAGEVLGDVTVSPETVPFGKTQNLRIAELKPRAQYIVELTARETFQVVYRRPHTSDRDGIIEIEIFAEAGDTPGLHAIAVYDEGGDLSAAGFLTILPRPERDVSVTIRPGTVEAGAAVEIAVGGLAAFDSVTAQITSADDVLIDTVMARASSDGESILLFNSPAELADGIYDVDIFVEGELLASAALHISELERAQSAVSLLVDPPQGPIGTRHSIVVSGLAAEQTITLVILDPHGAEAYSAAMQTDAAGAFSLNVSSTDEDDPGRYTIEIRAEDGGPLLASATFEITAAEDEMESVDTAPTEEEAPAPDAVASVEPQSAVIGSSHLVTVRQLGANETVTIDVVFAGASVYTTEKTADELGIVTLELVTGEGDQAGDYRVNILRARGNQPAVALTAIAKPAPLQTSTAVADAEVIAGSLLDGAAEVKFAGEAGQFALIRVASADFDPAAALIDRDDFELAFNDDSRGQKDAIIGPLSLPYSGEYSLVISAEPLMMPQGAESGDFTVTIAPVTLLPIRFDADLNFALSEDLPAQYYRLPVQTGDSLTITVDSGGAIDTLLQVVSPAGEEFAFDDDSGAGFDAELSNLIFDRAASFVLVVSTFDEGANGAGTITVSRNPVHSLDDGGVTIALNDKAIRDLVVFDAAEDELLVLNLEVIYGDVEDLYVTATINGMEVMSYSTMGVPDELPLAFVTPMSGTVVVTLEKFGYDDGIALDVSLERP